MKHAESFNFKYMTVFVKTPEKARQYQTPEESEELEQLLRKLDSTDSENDIPEPERSRISDRLDEILLKSTTRFIMETFPHDLKTLMQDAESDLKELDPQRIKAAWMLRNSEILEQEPEPDLISGDSYTRSVIAKCMQPYARAFLVFRHDLNELESLINRYCPAPDQSEAEQTDKKPPAIRKQYHSIFPSQYVIQFDNATHMAFEGIANHVWNMAPTAKKPVNTYVSMYFEQSELDRLLDRMDGEIFRCVVSLMLAGNNQFTASNIWQTSCNDKSKRPSPKQFERIYEGLRRMQKITLSINYSEYARLKNWDETGQIDAQFMPGLVLNPRRNQSGQITEIYIHCKNPVDDFPLYMFAVKTGQIQGLPIGKAAVTGNISMTEQAITIRSVLLERIVKNHRSKSDQTITFKSLYEKVNAQNKTEQKRARDAAKSLLIDYVKQGTIHGFAFREVGRSLEAILIAKTPEKKETFPEIPESDWTQRKC